MSTRPDRVVLVVDDSPEDAELVTRLLSRAPDVTYRVRQLEYGREVSTAMAELRPDCILLDHHLPDCTGLDVLDRLGAEYGTMPVPVIMLTGSHVLVGTAVAAMQRGAMDYIAKESVTATLLYRAIENAIARFTDARLLEAQRQELARRNRALDVAADRTARLLAIATQLGAATTPLEVAHAALTEIVSATGATGGAVLAVDEMGAALDVLDARGLAPEHVRLWRRAPLSRDLDPALARGGEPLWLETRAETLARYPALAGAAGGDRPPIEALALLPLVMDSRVAGELVVAWAEPHQLPADERAFLLTASRLVGQAVERARLLQTTQRALREAETARTEAEAANALKSKFLATMSHELRTPLNAISGYVDLLELGVRGPLTEPQREDLGRVRRAQQHLLALINDVLDFARIESGRVEFRLAGMSLADELATVHALIAPQAAARALELVLDVPVDAPRVVADADRVRQILLNLMSNAVKFTAPGGTVRVRVRGDDDMALVHVEDTGIGIERSQLEAIFEPFVQVDGTLTRTREGTGLGLAISRELARGMGGDLTVRSRPGEGSIFTLHLPVERG